jgi:indolepyruvate ferredoxin oxidoreductase
MSGVTGVRPGAPSGNGHGAVTERPPSGAGVTLDDIYEATSGRALMSGIQALVRLAIDQRRLDRLRGFDTRVFVSGYEGSPLGGVDLELHRARRYLDEAGVFFTPGLNEELAATSVAGTQLLGELAGRRHQGVVGFWYGKNPGLDRAADAIRHGVFSGTAPLGGAVAWVGDDPNCKSSTLPSSCESMARSLAMPILTPTGVSDLMRLGLHAVALSRYAGVWSALKIVSENADAAAVVDLTIPVDAIPLPDLTREAHPPILVGPRSLGAEEHLYEVRLPRVAAYAREVGFNAVTFEPERPRLGLVASGLAYAAVVRALEDLGVDEAARQRLGLRLIKLAMPWPLDPAVVGTLVEGLEEVVVLEDKSAFVESQIKEALYRAPRQPLVVGKTDERGRPLVPHHGSVDTDLVIEVLRRRLPAADLPEQAQRRIEERHQPARVRISLPVLPARTPYFCSGCPHNVSTRAESDQLVGIGIGCHIMAALDPHGRGHMVGMTQMGGEGAQWIGLAPFTDDAHYLQNLGDGTFFHSGSLAVRAAVAAGVDITYKLLYNDAVAMTGGQTPEGRLAIPELTRLLALEGVRKIVVTAPDPGRYEGVTLDPIAEVRHRDELADVQQELSRTSGVTVLIHDDRCAAEERRLRKRGKLPTEARRVWINSRVCEGCGDCGEKSTCLSVVPVETEFGRKTQIHQPSCNQDFTCLKGDCPAFVVVTPSDARPARPVPDAPAVADPPRRLDRHDVLIRMPGIGGTGVVTVSRVLQMAAHIDGIFTAGLDQTGLAQKGGPVISDVRLSDEPVEGAVAASDGSLDLLLGLDLLGAASPRSLEVAAPGRTFAVVNTTAVATAAMVTDTAVHFPPAGDACSRIEEATRAGENAYLNAGWIAERLFGDHLPTNMVMLGAAFQHGCIPLSAESIEQAITLNGAAVATNRAAFHWGRAAIADPDAVTAALTPKALPRPPVPAAERLLREARLPPSVVPLVRTRVTDLVAYQDARYAARYLREVEATAAAEARAVPGTGHPVTAAYARYLHKLMAYKDEYEVARLHRDPVELAARADELGPDARARVMLHPPTLGSLGLRRKIHLGPAARPAFWALQAGRRLRGTPFDPFGRTEMRRTERALVDEYRRTVAAALTHLRPDTEEQVVAIAELPDAVRGYEDVKRRNIERFRSASATMLRGLEDSTSGVGVDAAR